MLSLLFLRVKVQQYFVSLSYMFLDLKTVLKIWLNPGYNSTIFRRSRPRSSLANLFKLQHFRLNRQVLLSLLI